MKKQYLNGILAMIFSSVVFAVMSGMVRYADNIDSFKTSFFRFAIGIALLSTAAIFNKIKLDFFSSRLLFSRGFFGGIATFIYYLSISKIGLAKGTIINYSYPIFVAVIGMIFLKEKISPLKWLMIISAFAGLFLISSSGSGMDMSLGLYEAIAVMGAVFSAIAIAIVKKLRESESSYSIFFSQCVIGFWLVVVPAELLPSDIGLSGGIILLLIGITAAIGQLAMTYSYKYLPVSTGSLLSMLTPIFNIFIGVFLFSEKLSPGGIAGVLLILVSCAVIITKTDNTSSL
ncbi:MAG: hypothetical protein A2297_06460 [Elusimicrobia bacterium RIFOXYB2_FULL_48_7]|nr:MAG: hypothetical protein A2297_06460 [Elusimicrobia bacterium RIFOXYB2_FULL_48_7]